MRGASCLLVCVLLAVVPTGSAAPAAGFGDEGDAVFAEIVVPDIDGAPEPTLGIPWNTDSVFYHAGATTMRARFDETGEPEWTDVTPLYQVPTNLDPMLHADPDHGRVWAGGLHGPCSIMMYSDDDGSTWLPTLNMCSGARFDHQSIGSGPAVLPLAPAGYQTYYCGQLGAIACATSLDGGVTWLPFQDVPGPCEGFHGHIRASPTSGFVAVPVPSCGGELGFIGSADGGVTWASHAIPDTETWSNGFDPSLQFTRESGWLYYGMASEHGVHVGLSKDEGASWEPLGAGMNVTAAPWLDIGQFHDPPVVAGTFVDVQAGDDERVAVSFLGLEGGGADAELLGSNGIYACGSDQEQLVWHYYVAFSYDAGDSWVVHKLTGDPVQVGGIYDAVVEGEGDCRNLLDFNDMDIDSQGRVHVSWADGCVAECAQTAQPGTDGYRAQVGKLFRQTTGKGLFAAFDTGRGVAVNETVDEDAEQNFASPVGLVALFLAAVALLVRRPARRRGRA